jgi:hypothetical protein
MEIAVTIATEQDGTSRMRDDEWCVTTDEQLDEKTERIKP